MCFPPEGEDFLYQFTLYVLEKCFRTKESEGLIGV